MFNSSSLTPQHKKKTVMSQTLFGCLQLSLVTRDSRLLVLRTVTIVDITILFLVLDFFFIFHLNLFYLVSDWNDLSPVNVSRDDDQPNRESRSVSSSEPSPKLPMVFHSLVWALIPIPTSFAFVGSFGSYRAYA